MSCKYNNCKHCGYKSECEIYKENAELQDKLKNLASVAEVRLANWQKLEKENVELKEKYVKNICNCDICDTYCNSQLIKAKEIIKDLCGMVRELNKPNVQLTNVDYSLSEAEQFLNSEVKNALS